MKRTFSTGIVEKAIIDSWGDFLRSLKAVDELR